VGAHAKWFPQRVAVTMSTNLPLVIREYVLKMLHEAAVGMKALILDDFTVRVSNVHEHEGA
jgi:vacuolar protein sorting-associated protein 45